MNILIIEDNDDHAEIISDALHDAFNAPPVIARCEKLHEGLTRLEEEGFDLCLCDLKLPDSPLNSTIETLSKSEFPHPIIVLTSVNSDAIAIQLIKAGIQDFISKEDLDPEYLYMRCQFAIERKAMQRDLQEKTRDYEAFCHSLSHDFNAALRRINQCTQFLKESLLKDRELEPDQNQWLAFVQQSAIDAQTLTNDLYLYISAENQTTGAPSEAVNLNEITSKLLLECDQRITVEHCKLPWVFGNASQLQLILKNLIENAAKYNRNEPQMRFDYSKDDAHQRLVIRIDDNGIGIPPDKTAIVFTPFTRLDNKLGRNGTGLGLSLVQRILKHMQGSVKIVPSTLGGTCFEIRLPLSMYAPNREQ